MRILRLSFFTNGMKKLLNSWFIIPAWFLVFLVSYNLYNLNQATGIFGLQPNQRKAWNYISLLLIITMLYTYRKGNYDKYSNACIKLGWLALFLTIGVILINCWQPLQNPYLIMAGVDVLLLIIFCFDIWFISVLKEEQ
jgi:hypothetical protein